VSEPIRTGLWKKESDRGGYYGGKIVVTEPGEYWVNLYKNDRKESEQHPDLNLILKPKDAAPAKAKPAPTAVSAPDDDFPF
jgi:hypothetical protein